MKNSGWRCFTASSVASLFLIGCGLVNQRPVEPQEPSPDRMDVTIGTYGQGREEGLVLVTIAADVHQSMVHHLPISSGVNAPGNLPNAYSDFLKDLSSRFGLTRVADWPLSNINIHCLVFESDGLLDRSEIVAQLNSEERIETAQAMNMFEVQQTHDENTLVPSDSAISESNYDDPYLPLQHGFDNLQAGLLHQWGKGSGVSVAVIDTGVDIKHPEFVNRISESRNFVDSDDAQFSKDVHGTAVAGIIAAAANNGIGMVGVAPDASLMPLKACWQQEDASESASCNSFTLAKALNFAIERDVQVINLSLTGPRDPLLERLVKVALDHDIVVVGATSGKGASQFPASVAGTWVVGADVTDQSHGLLAPGKKILSTRPDNNYQFFDGSSFSAAHIAGLAALLTELRAEGQSIDLLELLERTANPETGEVDACRAVSTLVRRDNNACRLTKS